MVPISAYEMSTHADFVACIALYVTPVAAHCDSTRTPRGQLRLHGSPTGARPLSP